MVRDTPRSIVWSGVRDRKVSALETPLLSFEGIGPGRSVPSVGAAFFEVTERVPGRDLAVPAPLRWAYSSVGLEHTPDKREVGSSNLPRPTNQVIGGRT